MAQTHGLGIIPWSPLASGFLTGKYQRNAQAPSDARLNPESGRGQRLLQNENAFDLIELLQKLANEKNCTVGQLALAWCMNQPGITSPIIGPRTMEQLKDNLGCIDIQLTEEDHEQIDAICPPGGVTVPYYQANWGPHAHRF